MTGLQELLKTVEKNYEDRNKRETAELEVGGKTFEVVLLTRAEKLDLYFSKKSEEVTFKSIYNWLKPVIYKCLQLKDLAVKAKEAGYIKNYYDVIEMLFSPCEIQEIIYFILQKNEMGFVAREEIEAQKKQ